MTLRKMHTNLSVFREGMGGRELAPSAPPLPSPPECHPGIYRGLGPSCPALPGPDFLPSCTLRFSAAVKPCPRSLGWKLYINEVNQAPALPTGM